MPDPIFLCGVWTILNESGFGVKKRLLFYEIIKTKLFSRLPVANIPYVSWPLKITFYKLSL